MTKPDATSASRQVRWWIVALLFTATTINYIDRQVLGVLKPVLMPEMGWDEADYGNIVFAFQMAYAVGLLAMGRFIDWAGVRLGLMIAVLAWSLAAASHALAATLMGFMMARFALGLAEAGNFPSCIRAVTDWFPQKQRAFATGLFNSGSNIGAILTPLTVPWITARWGWRAAFLCTAAVGLLWVVWWWRSYRSPEHYPGISEVELAYIRSDGESSSTTPKWRTLFLKRPTWAFMFGKFLTDPVWWFYLFWIPGWLWQTYHLDLRSMGLPLVTIYLVSDAGSIFGGWISSRLIQRGWSINAARKITLLGCALAVLPVTLLPWLTGLWSAVAVLSMATAAHQAWSANLFTTVSDTQPRSSVGSVVGLGGMAGAVGGMLIAKFAGFMLSTSGSYVVLFAVCASSYLVALLIIQILVPKMGASALKN